MKCKYTEIPTYEEVDIAGKTVEAITGTIDRKPVGRVLITTAAGFAGKHQVVGGDGTAIRTVQAIGENEGDAKAPELFVRLVGDIKSLASYKFYKGFVAKNAENPECVDLFTEDGEQVNRLVETARRMCADHPECDSRWEITDANGVRYFLRKIATSVNAAGKVD